jgi:SAM-dependent methyltransferase
VTSRNFADHYRDYYPDDEHFSAWREASAREKFANIARLWGTLDEGSPPRVIDIGCGDGAIAAEMARRGFYSQLTGVDVSPSGIAVANSRRLPNAQFTTIRDAIEGADKRYDLAILSHVVEHVEEPRRLIREAARLAKWTIIEVPLEHTIRHRGDFVWTDTGHVNFYDTDLIRKLVQSCDLKVLRERLSVPGEYSASLAPGSRGRMVWKVKRAALAAFPLLASHVFVYHDTLLVTDTR